MNQREIWAYFDAPYDKYMISNYGKIKTKTGRYLKPEKANKTTTVLSARLSVIINGVKQVKRISIAKYVYLFFSVNPPKYENFKCIPIDGDESNLYIGNLYCVLDDKDEVQQWQIELYNKDIYKNLYSLAKRKGLYRLQGFDIENLIAESALLIYKYLPTLKHEKFFYSFCAKYMQMVFLSQYGAWKNEKPFDPVKDALIFNKRLQVEEWTIK